MSRRAVCLGLFAVWAVHDLEEVLTATWWSERTVPRLLAEGWPPGLVESIGSTTPRFALAAALVGVAVLAAAVQGARTDGESRFFRAALLVFGWHGAVHAAQAIALRDYVPGLVTAVVLVIPYSIWAWRRLRPAPVPGRVIAAVALAAIALTVAAQALARILLT
ncbi:HXXEE domain-containing protein [Actinoplanes sp. NPDC049802]|uniref:HXXEE domain-containing protein n=1 Tax=Actinoplanes sp. NPDC049802 TaxID=3154742 RepID=UPI0033D9F02E